MAGKTSAPSVVVPTDLSDPRMLTQTLNRIIERVDTAFGDRGMQIPTATLAEITDTNTSSSVGLNREDSDNTLVQKLRSLETRIESIEYLIEEIRAIKARLDALEAV